MVRVSGEFTMMLYAHYTCQAGHTVAIRQNALNDAPDERREPDRSLFGACDECEIDREDGYCTLKLEKITR